MRSSIAVTIAWSSLALASACGGKVIFEQSSSAGGAGGSSGTVFGPKSATTGTGVVTNGSVSPTVTTGSVVPATSGSVAPQASSSTGVMSSVVSATSSGSGLPPVFCNGAPCASGDICCFNPNGMGDHCAMSGQCMPGYVELDCSQAADCPGEICCAKTTPMGSYAGISCSPTCAGPDEHIICTKNPGLCPPGQACHQSMQLGNGYRICY